MQLNFCNPLGKFLFKIKNKKSTTKAEEKFLRWSAQAELVIS